MRIVRPGRTAVQVRAYATRIAGGATAVAVACVALLLAPAVGWALPAQPQTIASGYSLSAFASSPAGDLLAVAMRYDCPSASTSGNCPYQGGVVPWTRTGGGAWTAREAVTLSSTDVGAAVGGATAAVIYSDGAGSPVSVLGGGLTGPWSSVVLDSSPGASASVSLAADGDGRLLAAWRSAGRVLTATRETDGSWSSPAVLDGPSHGSDVSVAMNSRGDAAAIWLAGSDGRAVMAATRSGGTWTTPAQVGSATYYLWPRSIKAAIDESGRATVAWVSTGEATNSQSSLSTASAQVGNGFGAATTLGPVDNSVGTSTPMFDLAAAGDQTMAVVSDRVHGRVLVASLQGDGSWGTYDVPFPSLALSFVPNAGPAVGVGPTGAALVVWPVTSALAAIYRPSAAASWGKPIFVAGGPDGGDGLPRQLSIGVDQGGVGHAVWSADGQPPALRTVDVGPTTTSLAPPQIKLSLLTSKTRSVLRARAIRLRVLVDASGYLTLTAGVAKHPQVNYVRIGAGHAKTFRLHLRNATIHAIKRARPGKARVGVTLTAVTNDHAPVTLRRKLKLR